MHIYALEKKKVSLYKKWGEVIVVTTRHSKRTPCMHILRVSLHCLAVAIRRQHDG